MIVNTEAWDSIKDFKIGERMESDHLPLIADLTCKDTKLARKVDRNEKEINQDKQNRDPGLVEGAKDRGVQLYDEESNTGTQKEQRIHMVRYRMHKKKERAVESI